jgi:zinc protease
MARSFALAAALTLALAGCGGAPKPPAPSPSPPPPTKPAPVAADPEPFRATRPAKGAPSHSTYPTPELARLGNGLSVYFIARSSRVVALRFVVRHGASSVDEGKSGLADLTARMLTESTRKKSSAALAEAVESLGTTLSSGAERDGSEATLTVLPGDVPRALGLLAEVATTPAFAEDDFARVKNEWLDTLRAERQNPQRLATLAALRALWGNRFGAPVAGSVPDVEKLTTKDLRDFHRRAYTPDSAALIVVGDLDKAKLTADIERAFGTWRGKDAIAAAPAPTPAIPAKTRVLVIDRADAVQSAMIAVTPAPKRSDPGYEARQIVGRALGGLFTSRLNSNLREKHAYTYGAIAQPVASRTWGALIVSTSVRTDVTAPALDEIMVELKKIRDPSPATAITADEIQRSKADLVFGVGSTLEHPSRIADVTSELFVHALPLDYETRYPERLAALAPEAIQTAANAISADQLLVVIVGDRAKIEPALKQRGYAVELAPSSLTE